MLSGISPLLTFLPILWFLYPFFATSDCLGGLAERSRKDSKVRTQRVVEGYVFEILLEVPAVLPTSQLHMPNALEAPAAWEASQSSRQDMKVRSSEIRRRLDSKSESIRCNLERHLVSPSIVNETRWHSKQSICPCSCSKLKPF